MGISQPIPGGGALPEPLPASTCTTSSTQVEFGGACVLATTRVVRDQTLLNTIEPKTGQGINHGLNWRNQ
jgi:hypothetical protein